MIDADPNFAEKLKTNTWEKNFDEVVEVIKKLSACQDKGDFKTWSWTKSRDWRCKYISLHIDMRDGGFTIRDKDGYRISLEELKFQYKDNA